MVMIPVWADTDTAIRDDSEDFLLVVSYIFRGFVEAVLEV
jgi:hypothetical protein